MTTKIEIGPEFHYFDPKVEKELDWSESGVDCQQVSEGYVILLSPGQHITIKHWADVINVGSVETSNGDTKTEGTYKSLYHFQLDRFWVFHFPTLDFKLEGPGAILTFHNYEMGEVKISNDPESIGPTKNI